jgi:hypothetical protein
MKNSSKCKPFLWLLMLFICIYSYESIAQSRLDILHIDLKGKISQQTQGQYNGTATIKGVIVQKPINSIQFDLIGLKVSQVISNGIDQLYTQNDSQVVVNINENKQIGDTLILTISYGGKPVQDAKWGGFYFNGNYSYNMGVAFASLPHNFGRCWFPCNDNFTDKSTYSFEIEVDKGFAAICNGLLKSADNNTWKWEIQQVIPSYLVNVAVGKYVLLNDTVVTANRSIPIVLAVEAKDSTNLKISFSKLKQALQCFEAKFGPYLFDRIGFVGVPFNSGAMEHASNISYPLYAIDGSLQYQTLMAHEFSHHWFGNLVTCSNASDMWLNEGWASYCEALFLECVEGKEAYLADINDKVFEANRWAALRDHGYRAIANMDENFTYGTHVYTKGALMVHNLRLLMGDEAFFKGIKSFLNKYQFKNAGSFQLRDELQNFTSKDLTAFFQHWIFEAGQTAMRMSQFQVTGKQLNLAVEQLNFLHPKTDNALQLTIRLYSKLGSFVDFPINSQKTNYQFELPDAFEPAYYVLNHSNEPALAKTYELKTIKGTGIQNVTSTLFSLNIQSNSDSSILLSEHYFVGINPNDYPIKGIAFSPERFWRIDGSWASNFKASAFFNYDGRNDYTNQLGGLDPELFKFGTENDLVLLYRPKPDTAWTIETALVLQTGASTTDKIGRFWLNQLKKGEYVLGMKNAAAGIIQNKSNKKSFKIYPNPSKNELTISSENKIRNLAVNIYDLKAQLIISKEFENAETEFKIPIEQLKAGTYVLTLSRFGQFTESHQFVKE